MPLTELRVEPAFPNLSFDRMVHLTCPDDGTSRLFLVLQPGRIMGFDNHSNVTSMEAFLDIRDRVNDSSEEEGLLAWPLIRSTVPMATSTSTIQPPVQGGRSSPVFQLAGTVQVGPTRPASSSSSRSRNRSAITTEASYYSAPTATCISGWGTGAPAATHAGTVKTDRLSSAPFCE